MTDLSNYSRAELEHLYFKLLEEFRFYKLKAKDESSDYGKVVKHLLNVIYDTYGQQYCPFCSKIKIDIHENSCKLKPFLEK